MLNLEKMLLDITPKPLAKAIGNIARGMEAFVLNLIDGDVLYITPDAHMLESIAHNIKCISPQKQVLIFPQWDCLPYDRVSPKAAISKQRLGVLSELLSAEGDKVIITTVAAMMQVLPPKSTISVALKSLQVGSKMPRTQLLQYLEDSGFSRYSTASAVGEYAVRGSIVDIIVQDDEGVRIDFFGDVIESIRQFDPVTQLSTKVAMKSLSLFPVGEVIFNNQSIEVFKTNYLSMFGISNDPLFNAVSAGQKYPGMEHWLPLFYKETSTLFEYLAPQTTVVIDDISGDEVFKEHSHQVYDYYNSRHQQRLDSKEVYHPVHPSKMYLNEKQIAEQMHKFPCHLFSQYKVPEAEDKINANLLMAPSFHVSSKAENIDVYSLLKFFIKEGRVGSKVYDIDKFIICCSSEGTRERLALILKDHEIKTQMINNWQQQVNLPAGVLGLMVFNLERGVIQQKTLLASEQDILGERQVRAQTKRRGNIRHIQELNMIAINDYVVHIEHGIGIFSGLEAISVEGIVHDFIKITYHDDDKLYLPVENFELISRYGAGEGHAVLDKLGSAAWQRRKAVFKDRIKMAAEQLFAVAAARKLKVAPILEALPEFYKIFCDKFPYVETDDQQRAIEEILTDLSSGTPADRLICGDVGFGKTEVAMRAVAAAVLGMNAVQVAVIVPTTLLSRQHYQNFCQRFEGLPVKIGQLSKFVSTAQAKATKIGLENGEVDIVIGTHALLAKDLKFKNLGLIVIDEEQHFGVAQKEKLKQLKSDAHIITLSATPIPRTMQMSLSGIKELSMISSPPMDRLPVNTVVMPFDGMVLREAIMREHFRGGRTFYITPRIQYIDEIYSQLQKIVPEVKIGVAHGQMSSAQLDKIMNDFYDGTYTLLLSTTIIESGLDISLANTMIIDRPEMFGLAQLYQIRGRVGRSKQRAYAYLITKQTHHSEATKRRLEVIQSLDHIGAGMMIATHDMDIRGYGNLVGEEQSGHIKEVGVELYQSMLSDAIEHLSNQDKEEDEVWSPLLNIGVSVQLPNDYIGDISLKLSVYKKLTQVEGDDALEEFALGLIDRFGPLPDEAAHLIEVLKLKQLAKEKHVAKIDCGEKAVVFTFYNNKPSCSNKVMQFIMDTNDAKLRPDGKMLVMRVWKTAQARLKGLRSILQMI